MVSHLALEMKLSGKYDFVAIMTDSNIEKLNEVNRLLGFREEKKGHVFDPIEVDTLLQVQTISDVSLRYIGGVYWELY